MKTRACVLAVALGAVGPAEVACGGTHPGAANGASYPQDGAGSPDTGTSTDAMNPANAQTQPDGASFPQGGAGCGLPAAAFCDTFDKPSTMHGRAGELDPLKWSGSREFPQFPTAYSQPLPVMPAVIPSCRASTPATAFPDGDTLICDPNAMLGSNHLLVAVASQNYGQNSYRIRQPFDFAGRTGKIVFDAEAFAHFLLGWVSIEVTEDPIPVPSFAIHSNQEGAVVPKNAFEVSFDSPCGAAATAVSVAQTGTFSLGSVQVFNNYVDTVLVPQQAPCLATQHGSLNHFEIDVSQNRIDVYATPFSANGTSFDAPQLLYGTDVNLPFTRGYVHITTRNHATIKYSQNNQTKSWFARWDNVGFDGPIITNWREYEVPDSLVPYAGAPFGMSTPAGGSMNIGYLVADESKGPNAPLHFSGVDLTGVATASLALSAWYELTMQPASASLRYRLNGGTWHDRMLTAGELGLVAGPTIIQGSMTTTTGIWGLFGQMIDVPVGDLVAGDNTLEFVTSNIDQSYPPAVLNVDLVLATQ
jgi:hypothetical protein